MNQLYDFVGWLVGCSVVLRPYEIVFHIIWRKKEKEDMTDELQGKQSSNNNNKTLCIR